MHPLIIPFFGVLGNILSCMEYLSPMPTLWRIVKNKSTEEFDCLPYICVVLNSSFWTYYGLIKPDYYISTVNGFGFFIETIYIFIFLLYAPSSKRMMIGMIVLSLNVGLGGGAILVSYKLLGGGLRTQVVGSMCLTPLIVMFASPLAIVGKVIKTRSVEFMPFWLSFNLFWSSGIWMIYSFLTRDYFLGVPNAIGFVLGSVQLTVYYCIYRSAIHVGKGSLSEKLIEEGLLHDPPPLNQFEEKNHK